jgi:hypothetical protein
VTIPAARKSRRKPKYADSVFINCPFDQSFWPLFEAIVFCTVNCGFVPRCALEAEDSGESRLEKIFQLIHGSQYSIHDISRIEVRGEPPLPRFNMPFELGLDLGCRRFGTGRLKRKKLLVLDAEKHRYDRFISDLSGSDIAAHRNLPGGVIDAVRRWLRVSSRREMVPTAASIKERFLAFGRALPHLCQTSGVDPKNVHFVEYVTLAELFLQGRPR